MSTKKTFSIGGHGGQLCRGLKHDKEKLPSGPHQRQGLRQEDHFYEHSGTLRDPLGLLLGDQGQRLVGREQREQVGFPNQNFEP